MKKTEEKKNEDRKLLQDDKIEQKNYFSPCHATFSLVSCNGTEYGYVGAMSLLLDWNYNILEKLAKMPVDLSMFGKLVGKR